MRLNAIQLLTNSAITTSTLLIPIVAQQLGASGTQIGVIVAAYNCALFISTYIFSRASDSYSPKIVLCAGFLSATVTFFLQIFAKDPLSLGIVRVLVGFSVGIFPAILLLYVYNLKRSVGKFSSLMALGWALGYLSVLIIAEYPQLSIAGSLFGYTGTVYMELFALSSLLFAVAFLITLKLPDVKIIAKKKVDYFSADILKKNRSIYFGFFLRQVGANNVWVIFQLYLLSLGANLADVALIYMLNPVLQFFIMRRLDRYSSSRLIHTGDLLSAAAFAALIPLTIYYQAVVGMVLIAFSYACLYIGSIQQLIETNEEKGAAAGLLNSSIALASIVGSFMGGIILDHYGFRAVMGAGVLFSILGYAAFHLKTADTPQKSS
jgi:DHA1 family multidrug resistance protein-like MFS transporter